MHGIEPAHNIGERVLRRRGDIYHLGDESQHASDAAEHFGKVFIGYGFGERSCGIKRLLSGGKGLRGHFRIGESSVAGKGLIFVVGKRRGACVGKGHAPLVGCV